MARDRIEERGFRATEPDDEADSFRFGQPTETLKDAVVLELRRLFRRSTVGANRLAEMPTIRKYAIEDRAGSTAYDTFVRIHEDHPDEAERLPLVAVTGISGALKRDAIGGNFVEHVQHPPRVVTVDGPFTLPAPLVNIWTFEASGGAASLTVMGESWSVDDQGTAELTAERLIADAPVTVRQVVGFSRVGTLITLTGLELGLAVSVVGTGGVATEIQAASTETSAATLRFRAGSRTHEVVFDIGGVRTAEQLVQTVKEQVSAGVKGVASATGAFALRTAVVGPHSLEVLYSASSLDFVVAAGLASSGVAAAGDAFVGGVLTVAGEDFSSSVGTLTLVQPDGEIWATYPIVSGSVGSLTVSGAVAEQADLEGWRWFIGQYDDTSNSARPIMNRYANRSSVTLTVETFTSSANERRELADIVATLFNFILDDQHHILRGRGAQDPETYPQEIWVAGLGPDVSTSGRQEFARPGSQQQRVHAERFTLPFVFWEYVDRPLRWSTGPRAGESQTLTPVYTPSLPNGAPE